MWEVQVYVFVSPLRLMLNNFRIWHKKIFKNKEKTYQKFHYTVANLPNFLFVMLEK